VVELLKEHGARDNSLRPLLSAVKESHMPMIQYLLGHGAEPNDLQDKDESGTPLHAAATIGNVEVVELLLKHGADTSI
jgi:ankyrin repeat protein